MRGEWPTLSLREAGISLLDCEHRTPPASDTGYPYIAIPQIKQGRLDLSEVRRIIPDHYFDWTRKAKPQPQDVILSRRCNPGETAFVPPGLECALGQNLVLLRADGTAVFPPFLRWLVRGPEWWEQIGNFINVGAVFDSLKCADIPNFRLTIPPIAHQKAIAHILGTLDDKIELNRRMNETLETMARAIFKSWFVNFDPVRAKMDGRKPEGMDAATAKMFPDGFEESELGPTPRGWAIRHLGDLIELKRGHDLPERERKPGSIPIYSSSGLTGYHDAAKAKAPGVVTGRYGTIGQVFFVEEDFWPLNTTLYVNDFKGNAPQFAFHLLRTIDFLSFVDKAAVPGINRNHVHEAKVIAPPTEVQHRFAEFLKPLSSRHNLNVNENTALIALRDALLPRLLSGRVHAILG